jgi:outer membrane protein assembly factor BamB
VPSAHGDRAPEPVAGGDSGVVRAETGDVRALAGLLAAATLGVAACSGTADPSPPPSQPSSGASTTVTGSPTRSAGASPGLTGWTTYHGDDARTGFVAATTPVSALHVVRSTRLDGAVYAQPIVAPGPQGQVTIVVTENDTVYALRDGRTVWSTHLGSPVPRSALPCGNIDPLGITGTPVADPGAGVVYVAAELNDPIRHELVALDTRTGAVRWRRSVDPAGSQPRYEQQRAALALAGGRVWVALGGLFGDCGPYHGKVVGVRSDGKGALAVHQVPSPREAGIWAPSGPAVGPQGHLFVAVGNGEATSGAWDGSDSILELDTSARVVSSFAPADWAQENARDLDLGSMGPLLLPRGLVVASGKGGDVYVLRQGNLGGIGRPLAQTTGCAAYGGGAAVPGDGRTATVFLPCRDGVAALRVAPSGAISKLWQADGAVAGSPVVVGSTVLAIDQDGGRLVALDAGSGRQRAAVDVGELSRFATPMLNGSIAVLGTMTGVSEIALTPR